MRQSQWARVQERTFGVGFFVFFALFFLFLIFVINELALLQILRDPLVNPSQQFHERWSHFILSNLFQTTTV